MKDLDYADKNWVQHSGDAQSGERAHFKWKGTEAAKLLSSSDFKVVPFSYAVWEVTNDTYDSRTDASNFACILRATQSTLTEALTYVNKENMVLVSNMHPRDTSGFISDNTYSQ